MAVAAAAAAAADAAADEASPLRVHPLPLLLLLGHRLMSAASAITTRSETLSIREKEKETTTAGTGQMKVTPQLDYHHCHRSLFCFLPVSLPLPVAISVVSSEKTESRNHYHHSTFGLKCCTIATTAATTAERHPNVDAMLKWSILESIIENHCTTASAR